MEAENSHDMPSESWRNRKASDRLQFKSEEPRTSEGEATQLCPTLWDPMDCSLPGFSICGIFQARVLEWGAREKLTPGYFCFIDYAKAFDCVDHNKMWKILQEIRIPDNLTCLLRNMYAGQEATVRNRHETADWFKIGIGLCQGHIL